MMKCHKVAALTLMLAITWVPMTVAAAAQPAAEPVVQDSAVDPAAEALAARVVAAYQQLGSYYAKGKIESRQVDGTLYEVNEVEVAFDRKAGGLYFSMQQFRTSSGPMDIIVVGHGDKLRVKMESKMHAPLRHLEVKLDRLDLQAMIDAYPVIRGTDRAIDFHLLMSATPEQLLAGSSRSVVRTATGPSLVVTTPRAILTFHIDHRTHLISRVTQQWVRPDGQSGPTSLYTIQTLTVNEPIDAALYATAWEGSRAVSDAGQLVVSRQEMEANMVGRPAPAVVLDILGGGRFELAKAEQQVIVLDFWATWCAPCIAGMPHLERVQAWAKANNKSVQIYAVNLREVDEQVRTAWARHGLSLPVLMDRDGKVAEAFGVTSIPRAFVISDGKIQGAKLGFSATMQQELIEMIEPLLAGGDRPANAP